VKNGIPCTIIDGYDHITDKEVEYLWSQGVCLDDWDYMLLLPANCVRKSNDASGDSDYVPTGYTIERLLTGCCSNTWYVVNFRGKRQAIGVAYHA